MDKTIIYNPKKIKFPALALAITLFWILLTFPDFENQQAQKALALLVMVAVLWMTEAIPLAMTGLNNTSSGQSAASFTAD